MVSIAGSQTAPTSGSTQWAYDVLRGLGNSSPNGAQVGILTFISNIEGVPTDNNNPLDVSAPSGSLNEWGQIGAANSSVLGNEQGVNNGATTPGVWNTFGSGSNEHVLTYASYSGGVQATIDFLNHGHDKIVAVLTAKNPTKLEVAQGFLNDGAWGSPNSNYIGDAPKIAAWVTSSSASSEPGLAQYALKNGGYDPGVSPVELTPSATKWLASVGNPHTCDETKILIGVPRVGIGPLKTPGFNILNQCQAKAILGGLMVGLGASIMLFGIITIGGGLVSQTSVGRAVLGTANPVKRVLGAARAQRAETPEPRSPSPPPSPSPAPDAGRAAARRDWEAKNGKPWSESAAGRAEAQRMRS